MKKIIRKIANRLLRSHKVRTSAYIVGALMSWLILMVRSKRMFDSRWYEAQYYGKSKVVRYHPVGLFHYLLIGRRRGLTPSPFFIPELADSVGWKQTILDPLLRYVIFGSGKGSRINIFDFIDNSHRAWQSYDMQDTTKVVNLFDKQVEWSKVRKLMHDSAIQVSEQEGLRRSTWPTNTFNKSLEKKVIKTHKNTIFDYAEGKPLVSIITPVWNRESLIVEAIMSAQSQTFQDWEMIIVDDGSTDGTPAVVRNFQKYDSRIILLEPGRSGVCGARNHGLRHAKGKWIAFLDSDNQWRPDFLQTMISCLTKSESKVGYSAIEMIRQGTTVYRATKPDSQLLALGNYIDLNALVVHRSVLSKIGYFDETLRRMVDYDLVCRISAMCEFEYVPIIGVKYTDHEDADRITTTELMSWDGVVKSKNFISWPLPGARPKGLSVVVPVHDNLSTAIRCIQSVRSSDAKVDEIIILDCASTSAFSASMVLFELDDNVRYERIAGCRDATLGVNFGVSLARFDKVIVMDQRAIVEPKALKLIAKQISKRQPIVSAVVAKPSHMIASAGVVFERNASPINFLEDHPMDDLSCISETFSTSAVVSGCVGLWAPLFDELHGFNALYDKGYETHDYCLRVFEAKGCRPTIVRDAVVQNINYQKGLYSTSHKTFLDMWSLQTQRDSYDLWGDAGFEIVGLQPAHIHEGRMSKLVPLLKTSKGQEDGLRWAIKISAPAGNDRFFWGDLYYAQSLASALRRRGQRVAIDFHDFHVRQTSYLDDVVLDLRGLDNVKPQIGRVNIMWVISHPEKVTPEIIKEFDIVFAAGKRWANSMSQKSGKLVQYLPQCTDQKLFHPTPVNNEYKDRIVFVGNSRGVRRPIVMDAIKAGLDISVYGNGWEGLIDDKYIKGRFIPNDRLAEVYSSARVILNDHWKDMRNLGFISNRIFDAGATGAYIVTDAVEDLEQTLVIDNIKKYTSVEELKSIIENWSSSTSPREEREAAAEYIQRYHSFDARAEQLLQSVKELMKIN